MNIPWVEPICKENQRTTDLQSLGFRIRIVVGEISPAHQRGSTTEAAGAGTLSWHPWLNQASAGYVEVPWGQSPVFSMFSSRIGA